MILLIYLCFWPNSKYVRIDISKLFLLIVFIQGVKVRKALGLKTRNFY